MRTTGLAGLATLDSPSFLQTRASRKKTDFGHHNISGLRKCCVCRCSSSEAIYKYMSAPRYLLAADDTLTISQPLGTVGPNAASISSWRTR